MSALSWDWWFEEYWLFSILTRMMDRAKDLKQDSHSNHIPAMGKFRRVMLEQRSNKIGIDA